MKTALVYAISGLVILLSQTASAADSAAIAGVGRPAISDSSGQADFWRADSLVARRQPYSSFADILNTLPGISIADRGSTGQPLYASLFGAPLGRQALRYNGLDLGDPLTGLTDLNLIPTESLAETRVVSDTELRRFGYSGGPGQGISLRTMALASASVPVRTRIAYRTGGMGYDDIDLRLGLWAMPKARIEAGILLKNSDGIDLAHAYEAQKIDLGIESPLMRKFAIRYQLLRNISDLDLLLPTLAPSMPVLGIDRPHRKEVRTDHGFSLNLPAAVFHHLQITDLHREMYPRRDRAKMETVDALRAKWSSHWQGRFGSLLPVLGAQWQFTRLESQAWGDTDEHEGRWWSGMAWHSGMRSRFYAGAAAIQTQDNWGVYPEGTFDFKLKSVEMRGWFRKEAIAPTLAQRKERSVFGQGNSALVDEKQTSAGLLMQRNGERSGIAFSVAWIDRQHPVLRRWDGASLSMSYSNGPAQEFFCSDMAVRWRFLSFLTLHLRGQLLESRADDTNTVIDRPETIGRMQLEFHRIWFRGDLDFRFFVGVDTWGEQRGMAPFGAEIGGEPLLLEAAALPWLQITADVHDVSLFAMAGNALDLEVQSMPGFAQPGRFLRFGLVWNFYD